MKKSELEKLLKYWQKILRLQDWRIVIEFSEKPKEKGRVAENLINTKKKSSVISILPPELWEGWEDIVKEGKDSQIKRMIEPSIIHELLHLHLFWYLVPDTLQGILNEQAITSLELAFMELKKKIYDKT